MRQITDVDSELSNNTMELTTASQEDDGPILTPVAVCTTNVKMVREGNGCG